jgi:hypothetical protein
MITFTKPPFKLSNWRKVGRRQLLLRFYSALNIINVTSIHCYDIVMGERSRVECLNHRVAVAHQFCAGVLR